MREPLEIRKRLESATYQSLEAMMEAYAKAATEMGHDRYQRKLNFSAESVDALDEIVVLASENPGLDVEFEARLWGSYLGEVVRRRYAGSWEMETYPGGTAAVPAVRVRGSLLFPVMKVYRRLTMGEEDDLQSFFAMVAERLGRPAQVN